VSEQSQTSQQSLSVRLAEIDKQFSEHAMPVRLRPLEAFKLIHGAVPDGELRNSLFAPIAGWFIQRYGKRAEWDGVVARIPMLIRGNVYLLVIPAVTSETAVRLTDYIEGLPQEIAESMTHEEFQVWGEKAMLATSSVYKIYNLSVDDLHFSSPERDLLRRSLFDIENASTSLKLSEDSQGAIFHAHAAAEKFLKIGLKRAGHAKDMISHEIPRIFEKLLLLRPSYSWLKSAVDALQAFAPDMNIRYKVVPRTIENAVSAIYIALNICGALAQIWLFDLARGTEKSEFLPGRFYFGNGQTTFYCDRLTTTTTGQPGAVLMRFGNLPLTGWSIAELIQVQSCSSLYLEISDARQIAELRAQYDRLRQTCKRQINPKDIGLDIHSSPEGSYAGGVIQVGIKRRDGDS
jgi:hypothetical protein